MILDTVLTVTRSTASQNNEGMVIRSFLTTGTPKANVQPRALTQADLQTYGINEIGAEARLVFTRGFTWAYGDRFSFGGKTLEVRAINNWPNHNEVVALAVKS